MAEAEKQNDFTKTKSYATIDLTSKVLSSIALISLGLLGWMLQSQTEKTRQANDVFEKQERRYLPMLRSLSSLELELERLSSQLENPTLEDISDERIAQLSFVAESIYLPDSNQPNAMLTQPNPAFQIRNEKDRVTVPLKTGAIMFAELLRTRRMVVQTLRRTHAIATLNSQEQYLTIKYDGGQGNAYPSLTTLGAWQIWLRDTEWRLENANTIRILIGELRSAVSSTIEDVLKQNPELGDRYVQIRDDLEKSRSENNRVSADKH